MKNLLLYVIFATLLLSISELGAATIESQNFKSNIESPPSSIVKQTTTQESYIINSDPYENYNRNAYRMNATLDKNFVRPVTVWYITYVPNPLRAMINNFYNNLRDFVTLGNDILQFQGRATMETTMRISINSTSGLVGLIDVSSSLGLKDNVNTFGKTLKFYGWKNSSYIVIPLLGPSTVRDALGIIPDSYFNPTWYFVPDQYLYISVGLFAINGIDIRSQYLGIDQVLETSIDPYVSTRDAYLEAIDEKPPEMTNNNLSIDDILDNNESSNSNSPSVTSAESDDLEPTLMN